MKWIIPLIAFLLGTIVSTQPTRVDTQVKIVVKEVPLITYDTVKIACKDYTYFSDHNSVVTFCKYIKSQQSKSGIDQQAVIRTMYNRLEEYNCDWDTYYNTPSINHSHSIKLIRSNKWVIPFNPRKEEDLKLLIDVITMQYINKPKLPTNVLYFHSHPDHYFRNHKGIWNPNKLYIKYTHKFYYR